MSNIQCIKSSLISPPFILPDGWKWYKWGDLVVSYEQGLIRSNLDLVDHGTFYFKMHNIDEAGFCNYEKREYTKASDAEIAKYSISNGDFLINVRNSYELVGKTCVVSNIPDKATYNHMIIKVVHVDNRLNYYINALFSKTFWRKYVEACRKGTTTVIALYKDDLLNIPIPIPSEYVFNEIYELEKAFIDKRTKNLLICSELEMMAKTLYDYWFTQFDFPNEEGKPYRSSGGVMEWNEQLKREIPKGWDVTTIGKVTHNYDSKRIPLSQNERDTMKGEIPYYGATGIMDYVNRHIFDGQFVLIAEDGSVMDTKGNPVVQMIWGKTWVNNHSHVLQGYNGYSNELLYLLLQHIPVIKIMTGSIQKKINQDNLNGYKIPKIPDTISQAFHDVVKPMFEKIRSLQQENDELTKLRDWLLPMLMNGQATVE